MTVGQSQEINVTFTPPSSGNWDAQVVLSGSVFGSATVDVYAMANPNKMVNVCRNISIN